MHTVVAVTIRFPGELHHELRDAATNDRRSFNGEVVTLLEEALKERESKKIEPPR